MVMRYQLIPMHYMANINDVADATAQNGSKKGKSRRGFAAMSPERQREIASQGGRAAHQNGTAHQVTSEEAARAGRIGGLRSRSGGNRGTQQAERPVGVTEIDNARLNDER